MTQVPFAAAEQIRQYGERTTESAKAVARQAVDAYEKAVKNAVEFERTAADAAPATWIKDAIGVHASFVADLNAAYVGAARSFVS